MGQPKACALIEGKLKGAVKLQTTTEQWLDICFKTTQAAIDQSAAVPSYALRAYLVGGRSLFCPSTSLRVRRRSAATSSDLENTTFASKDPRLTPRSL